MPKTILQFKLPEEFEEHRSALQGQQLAGVIRGLRTRLRKARKYENREMVSVEEVERWLMEEATDMDVPWILE